MAVSDEIIAGYQFFATLDFKTCLLCAVLDLRQYKSAAEVPIHRHEGCRCAVLPVLAENMGEARENRPMANSDFEDDAKKEYERKYPEKKWCDLSDATRQQKYYEAIHAYEERTGKPAYSQVPGNTSFHEYFALMQESDKERYLGHTRYLILKKYHLELDDFVDIEHWHEYSEDELLAKYPLNQPSGSSPISVELNYLPLIHLALQQNSLPVVREMILTNNTGEELKQLECTFSSPAEFIDAQTVTVELLKKDEPLLLHDIEIELNYPLISSVSETLNGKLSLDICCNGQLLFHQDYEMTAYAADQWLGVQYMPELLCAFVTPNLEVINHLLTVVAEELQKATGSASIEGYQGDKKRTYEICAAVYRAIHSWGIHYANPASSFGIPGQRIRFADSIYQYRLGTCLDTTILFASALEQCGLHPVIMLQEGHAYIGCHLVDRYFSDLPVEDLQTIRKLADLDEFIVIETTMVTGNATFSEAEAAARLRHLNIDGDFHCAIDVIRARFSGIHPLPLKRSTEGLKFERPERNVEALASEHKRELQNEIDLSQFHETTSRKDRIARWTQKLLDLSLRNRLLNVRDTRFIIPIACTDITILEDKLAANESFSLNPLSNLLGEKDLHDLAMLRNSDIKTEIKTLLEKELQQKRLWTLLPESEMLRRLTSMYRQGKTDLEESGVNTLFLAVGFLEWKVSPKDEKSYLAPVLLVPIRMQRKSIKEGICISRIDEDTIINETLLELLRSQYHLNIPGLSPLPMDQSGVDVGTVMQILRQTLKDMPGWEVREEARIGLFSFGKFVMWTDMTARAERLKENPLVRHLMEGNGLFNDGITVFPPEEIAQNIDLKKLFCPMSADSSQLTAVLYSALGKSFVLHGPPGTGKSQTITNIIAHNLALGKRVLFVSEKKAALDVVHKRLSSIGLRPFCLELHSNKAGKTDVLKQFSEALNVPEIQGPAQWNELTDEMQRVCGELNGYVAALHHKYPNGLSAYDCFSRLLNRNQTYGLTFQGSCMEDTEKQYCEMRDLICSGDKILQNTTPEGRKILQTFNLPPWEPFIENKIQEKISALQEYIQTTIEALSVQFGITDSSGVSVEDVMQLYRFERIAMLLQQRAPLHDPQLLNAVQFGVGTVNTLNRLISQCICAIDGFVVTGSPSGISLDSLLNALNQLHTELSNILADESQWTTAQAAIRLFNDKNSASVPLIIQTYDLIKQQYKISVPSERLQPLIAKTEKFLSAAIDDLQYFSKQTAFLLQFITAYNTSFLQQLLNISGSALQQLTLWFQAAQETERITSFALNAKNWESLCQLAMLTGELKITPDIPDELYFDHPEEKKKIFEETRSLMEQYVRMGAEFTPYRSGFLDGFDAAAIERKFIDNEQCFPPIRWWKNRKLVRQHAAIKKLGETPLSIEELKALVLRVQEFQKIQSRYETCQKQCAEWLPTLWNGSATDWAKIEELLKARTQIAELFSSVQPVIQSGAEKAKELKNILHKTCLTLAPGSDGRRSVNTLINGCNDYETLMLPVKEILTRAMRKDGLTFSHPLQNHADIDDFCQKFYSGYSQFGSLVGAIVDWEKNVSLADFRSKSLSETQQALTMLAGALSQFRNFSLWKDLKAHNQYSALCSVFDALDQGIVPQGCAGDVFDALYAQAMLNQILMCEMKLKSFSRLEQEQRINKFCEMDEQYTKLTRKCVFAKLAATLPRRRTGPCPEGTELGLLKRECEKKARQKPVRQLLAEIPALVSTLKPCFLMSPLSVAQYLPPDSSAFDLVIFDEASQIPVWDAIGVIARGKQLIVVGDPKQMPPTNFFQKGDSAESDIDPAELEDLESILDECLAAGIPSCYLNWHYRSRHESLISFSNHYYYDDRLFTFPASCHSEKQGIKFQFVPNGLYDKRNTRTNLPEAQALVQYIFRQLTESSSTKRSMGIVTFSEAQKNLIEDLLEKERTKHPELENYFSDRAEEPLFVKNLENVQGDERDVILFSICYAPDITGRFSMNFGPLNRQGGERRLNVAITRAKEQVVVFSSIHAAQIELARTNAVGAVHLKYFLDYAEKGIHPQSLSNEAAHNENLVMLVEKILSEHGFAADRNIGCSGYRIDLAVKNPDQKGAYLLGIECDGPNYAAQKTTRDRDHLRHEVLRSLNWHIWQAWTVDWSFDRKQAETALLEEIEKARHTPAMDYEAHKPEEIDSLENIHAQSNIPQQKKSFAAFVPSVIVCTFPQEQFYEERMRPTIREQVLSVIQQEAPVYERVLKKRIAKAWQFNRTGGNIQAILQMCIPADLPHTQWGDDKVFWQYSQIPSEYRIYRTNQPSDSDKRAIDEIPPEELANAMYDILIDFNSCEVDTLFRETVKLFGLSAVTQKARKYLEIGLEALQKSGRV